MKLYGFFSFRLQNQFSSFLSLASLPQWSPICVLQIPRRCSRLLPPPSTLTRWLNYLFLPMVGPHLGKQLPDLRHSVDISRSRILPVLTTDNLNLRGYYMAHFDFSNCQVVQYFQDHFFSFYRRQRFGRVTLNLIFGDLSNTL